MKEPFSCDFPAELLEAANYHDQCPEGFEPKISYAKASHLVAPKLQLLKQLFSGVNIYTALLHGQLEELTPVTTTVPESFLGFFYVTGGDLGFFLRGQAKAMCLTEGKCFLAYIPAGVYHSSWLPCDSRVAYFVLHPEMIENAYYDYPELEPAFNKLLQDDPEPAVFHICDISKSMLLQLQKLGRHVQHRVLGTESAILSLFSELLEAQLQQLNVHQYSSMGRLEITMKVFEYIKINAFIGPLPKIEELADKFNIGHRTLLREFKNKFGYTLNEFVNSEKMDAAHYLLTIDGLSVIEVSERLGYADVQSFSRVFKTFFDYPPTEAKHHLLYKREKVSKNAK